ncbi:MAG TPA: hypothetical protein VFE62_03575 [Gemmataceae bacterium]|nr:hypothetical protein [Gemmataceae bacterium]
MLDPTIGECVFIDGTTRVIYLDREHRQYVLGDDGERVYGVWIYREEDHPDYLPIPPCKTTNA